MKNIHISIHKALTSLDGKPPLLLIKKRLFQSTRLSRASTWQKIKDVFKLDISIHKALTSLDSLKHLDQLQLQEFQSTRLSRASTFGIS